MLKLAPTLLLREIEPSLRFFTETLKFEKVMDVQDESGKLCFAMLLFGNVEIHLQSYQSVAKDMPYLHNEDARPSSFLYIDVEDVKSLFKRLNGNVEVLLPLEKTFYGATHFFVKEPGGHVIGFSQNEASET